VGLQPIDQKTSRIRENTVHTLLCRLKSHDFSYENPIRFSEFRDISYESKRIGKRSRT